MDAERMRFVGVRADMRGAVVLDTSVVIEGVLSTLLESGSVELGAVFISAAMVHELEHQANLGHETGFLGLDELKRLRTLCTERDVPLLLKGVSPSEQDVLHAASGSIDERIRRVALDENATLLTADRVQASVAEAMGISVHFVQLDSTATDGSTPLDSFFVEGAMSVHLKEDAQSVRKVGKPGEWRFEPIDEVLDRDAMQRLAKALVEQAGARKDSYIETERRGSTIIQLGRYRIVIAKPPFASGWEITAVRPVKQLSIDEYALSEKLRTRLVKRAEGILIAGAPGSGKSTFVQALASFYNDSGKIVKTLEAPRDLIVAKEVTQYSLSHASAEEIRDVLLLNRPDYTIFDEMRNTDHFTLYTDLRLAGVGMVGIVHATKPIDAIQRFMSRIDLGVIPHVVDTVVFIQAGRPKKVFAVDIQVKVPSGMTEEDLARPIVCISDFETDTLEYEVYTFGEQTMVIPVTEQAEQKAGVLKLAEQTIREYFFQYADKPVVDMKSPHKATVYLPQSVIPSVIGSGGANIRAIEKELGVSIDLKEGSGRASREWEDERGRGRTGKNDKKEKRGWKGKGEGRDNAAGYDTDFIEEFRSEDSRSEDSRPEEYRHDVGESEDSDILVPSSDASSLFYDLDIKKNHLVFSLGSCYAGVSVTLTEGLRALTTVAVDRTGHVVLERSAPAAHASLAAVKNGSFSIRRAR
jgi:ATPase